MLNELFHEAVPVILHEDDLNAMHFSIENRSPFLDRALFEFAYSIPTRHLVRNGYAKAVLRDAMRGIVPDPVLDSRRKVGFNAPVLDVLDPEARAYLLDDRSADLRARLPPETRGDAEQGLPAEQRKQVRLQLPQREDLPRRVGGMTLSPAEQLTAIGYGDTFALYVRSLLETETRFDVDALDERLTELASALGELASTIRITA